MPSKCAPPKSLPHADDPRDPHDRMRGTGRTGSLRTKSLNTPTSEGVSPCRRACRSGPTYGLREDRERPSGADYFLEPVR